MPTQSAAPAQSASAAPAPSASSSAAPATSAAPSASASAAPHPAPIPSGIPATAAPSFSLQCIGPSPAKHVSDPPRACILRGHIHAVKPVDTVPSVSWLQNGFAPAAFNRAVDVDITPDDSVVCPTPLDATAKENRLPEADYPDLSRAGRVRILGAERIAGELVAGKRICGWARFITRPGLGYPTGWEGELMGAEPRETKWKLLAAYSIYLGPGTNAFLSRSWSFVREGAARRIPIDEGGAFIVHDGVRIQHAGKSVVSKDGAEEMLKTSDGTFAVQAASDFTVGNVPVFVGKHDGFAFAAVRAEP